MLFVQSARTSVRQYPSSFNFSRGHDSRRAMTSLSLAFSSPSIEGMKLANKIGQHERSDQINVLLGVSLYNIMVGITWFSRREIGDLPERVSLPACWCREWECDARRLEFSPIKMRCDDGRMSMSIFRRFRVVRFKPVVVPVVAASAVSINNQRCCRIVLLQYI